MTIRNMQLGDISSVDKIRQHAWVDSYVSKEHGVSADLINDYFSYRRTKQDREEKVARILAFINDPNFFAKIAINERKKVVGFIFGEKTQIGRAHV